MFRLMILFIAAGLMTFCQQPAGPTYESDEERVIGSWNLERMVGGYTGREWNPASEGYTVIWHFADDPVLREWLDDSLTGTFDYHLATYVRPWDNEAVPVLYRGGRNFSDYSFDTDDMLMLDQGAIGIMDGFMFEFSRIR